MRSFCVRISFANGVNFNEIKGWIKSEQGKNIVHQLEFGVDQSI